MGKSRKEESRKKSTQKDRAKSGRERKKKAHTNKFKEVKRNEITTKTKSPFGMTIGSDFAKLNCIVKIFNMFV